MSTKYILTVENNQGRNLYHPVNSEGSIVDKLRYIDFGSELVLVEKTLNTDSSGKIRHCNVKEFEFDEIYTIFSLNKELRWLNYDILENDVAIFDKSLDKLYFLAKIPKSNSVLGEKISTGVCSIEDNLFRAVYVSVFSLLDSNRQDMCGVLLKEIGDVSLQRKIQNVFTDYEKNLFKEKLLLAVDNPSLGMFTEGRKPYEVIENEETSLLDLLSNLMEDPTTCFYPFYKHLKTDQIGFTPDPMFPVYFHQLEWESRELTLSVSLKVSGVFRFDVYQDGFPASIETYSFMKINLIKDGKPCHKKIAINTGDDFGYIDLSIYPMITTCHPPVKLSALCESLHNKNLAYLKYKVLLYILHKSEIKPTEDIVAANKKLFRNFTKSQLQYLANLKLTGDKGYAQVQKRPTEPSKPSFNLYEEELEVLLNEFDILLQACIEGKRFEDLGGSVSVFVYNLIHELLTAVFNAIYSTSDYFSNLKKCLEAARKEYLQYDSYIQKVRFFITYIANKLPEKEDCSLISVEHDKFNFIFEIDSKNYLGYSYA